MVSGKIFGDYESFMCMGVCALNQSFNLINKQNKNTQSINDIADTLVQLEISTGLNPTTISDLTGIPRATVIRKIQTLLKKNIWIRMIKICLYFPHHKKTLKLITS